MTLLSIMTPSLVELEVDLVAVDINGLDSQLIALFQLEWCAGGDGHLVVIIYQNAFELLVRQGVLIIGLVNRISAASGKSGSLRYPAKYSLAWNPITL